MRRPTSHVLRTIVAALLFGAGLVLASPTVASAAPCVIDPTYSGGPTITTDPAGTVNPGEEIEIIGTGFPPGCEVDIVIDGTVIGTVTTNPDGTFSFTYQIPGDFVGTLTIVITAGDFSQTITLQVVTPTTTTTPLVPTGSETGSVVGVGVALLAGGGLLVLAARKRREAAAPA